MTRSTTGDAEIDSRVALLIAFAKHANVLKFVLSREELKTHKRRIDKIAKEVIEALPVVFMSTVIVVSSS